MMECNVIPESRFEIVVFVVIAVKLQQIFTAFGNAAWHMSLRL